MATPSVVFLCALMGLALSGCGGPAPTPSPPPSPSPEPVPLQWVGADMSAWASEPGYYAEAGGQPGDPFQQLADSGATSVRLRIWNDPSLWGSNPPGSDLADLLASSLRAKAAGLDIFLDFHYSDTWADPAKQFKPQAWKDLSLAELTDAVRAYTSDVVGQMIAQSTPPALVQVGNEIRNGLLWDEDCSKSGRLWDECDGNWGRVVTLLNAALMGVHDVSSTEPVRPQTVIHLHGGEDPEGIAWWFERAAEAGLIEFDHIGMSYYPRWYGLGASPANVSKWWEFGARFPGKGLIMVETDYVYKPPTGNKTSWPDPPLFPYTPSGQKQFLEAILEAWARVPQATGLFWWGAEILAGYSGGKGAMWDESGVLLPVASGFAANRGFSSSVVPPDEHGPAPAYV